MVEDLTIDHCLREVIPNKALDRSPILDDSDALPRNPKSI